MVITLNGWCHDRYPTVASAMLIEVGLTPVDGVFRYGGFEPLGSDVSEAQSSAISGYFAPMTLAEAKAAKKAEIAAARWNEMSAPTVVEGYSATWYTDKESLDDMNRASINLQRAISLGHKPEGTTVEWKTANGTFVNLSLNDLITVELLLSQRQQELYTKESLLKNNIEAASTVNEVELLHW